jgi:DnaJ-domain-containing protein 1
MRTFDRQPDRAGVERPLFARRAKPPSDEEIEYRVYARPRSETGQRWDPFAEEQSRVHRVRTARHRPSTLPDYYKLLGLERGATDEQVERAYRRRAARIHPDRFHNDAEGRAAAEAQLKELNRAMQILRDPTRRAQYDAML